MILRMVDNEREGTWCMETRVAKSAAVGHATRRVFVLSTMDNY